MNQSTVPGLQVLILAAGYSRRLGQDKTLARIHGVGLLRRTVAVAASLGGPPPLVVVAPRRTRLVAELSGLPARRVASSNRDAGLAASLQAGLRMARWSRATLILAADLPQLQGTDLARLLRRWRARPRRIAARRIGARGGMPLVLPASLYGLALALRGDAGLRTLLAGLAPGDCTLVSLDSAESDIDTPLDLARARHCLRQRALPAGCQAARAHSSRKASTAASTPARSTSRCVTSRIRGATAARMPRAARIAGSASSRCAGTDT